MVQIIRGGGYVVAVRHRESGEIVVAIDLRERRGGGLKVVGFRGQFYVVFRALGFFVLVIRAMSSSGLSGSAGLSGTG